MNQSHEPIQPVNAQESGATLPGMMRKIICINSVVIALLMAFFFVYPTVRAVLNIWDPALREPGMPKVAWRLYRNLTPRCNLGQRKGRPGPGRRPVHQQHLGHGMAAVWLGVLPLGNPKPAGRLGWRGPLGGCRAQGVCPGRD